MEFEKQRRLLMSKLRVLSARRKNLLSEVKKFKEKRDRLNSEARKIIDEINTLRTEYKRLCVKISGLRAELNDDYSRLRGVSHLIEDVKLKTSRSNDSKTSLKMLKKRISKLEWELQTSPTDLQMEKKIAGEIAKLHKDIKVQERLRELENNVMKLKAIREAVKLRIGLTRKMLNELNGRRLVFREAIRRLEKKVESMKMKADECHKMVLEKVKEVEALKTEEKTVIDELKSIEFEEKKRAEEEAKTILAENARRALNKLRGGGRVTAEDFKAIAKAEDMGVI